MFTSCRDDRDPRSANDAMVPRLRPEACSMQSVPAASKSWSDSSPKQCAVTRAPSSWAAVIASASTSRGQQGARSPTSRSIQSPTSLTSRRPPRLDPDAFDQLLGLQLPREVAQVSARSRDVPTCPDDPWQVLAVVDPAGVCWRAGVADEQGARVPVGGGLGLARGLVHRPVAVQADVAVRVDQPGQGPSRPGRGPVRRRDGRRSAGRPRTRGPGVPGPGPVRTGPVNSMMPVMAFGKA